MARWTQIQESDVSVASWLNTAEESFLKGKIIKIQGWYQPPKTIIQVKATRKGAEKPKGFTRGDESACIPLKEVLRVFVR